MITITNNQGGKEEKLTVTKGAYEAFYKRLGYSIVDNKKEGISVEKADIPQKKEEPKEELKEEVKEEPKEEKVSKRKKI